MLIRSPLDSTYPNTTFDNNSSDYPDESVLPHRRSLVMTQFFLVPTLRVGTHTGLTPLHEMNSGRDYHTLLGINSERGNQLRYIFPGHRLIQQCMRATKAKSDYPDESIQPHLHRLIEIQSYRLAVPRSGWNHLYCS
jgi:hypothetical protein